MKSGNASLSPPEPNETKFVYLNASRSPAVNQEAAVQNAADHPSGFCSYSWCQMEGEARLRAGEQKGRWRWGEMKGEDSGDQFYLRLTRARPDMQERDQPEGGKEKERE
ncbi:hypothetical protein NQZ68_013914 [Dissostichus eleginoides]|nr:hypothetical protein NQZ68_013914 [Dissostichus eleginoides]